MSSSVPVPIMPRRSAQPRANCYKALELARKRHAIRNMRRISLSPCLVVYDAISECVLTAIHRR